VCAKELNEYERLHGQREAKCGVRSCSPRHHEVVLRCRFGEDSAGGDEVGYLEKKRLGCQLSNGSSSKCPINKGNFESSAC
jgi:hypothetical protein